MLNPKNWSIFKCLKKDSEESCAKTLVNGTKSYLTDFMNKISSTLTGTTPEEEVVEEEEEY